MECTRIDGARGEGGGQILRTAVALSCVTGVPVEVERIRRGRKVPGLRAQHLAAIRLLAEACGGTAEGLAVGSERVRFTPGTVDDSELSCAVGTAGSIPLVLQTVIVPIAAAGRRLRLEITGGTDVSWSPTADYIRHVLSAAYSRMGINFAVNVGRRGYYPMGEGRVSLEVNPAREIAAVTLTGRTGSIANLFCTYWGYPQETVSAEVERLRTELEGDGFRVNARAVPEQAANRGGAVLICSQDSASVVGSDGLLENLAGLSDRFAASRSVDANLADMLVVPASMADGTTAYRVDGITGHLETNLYVASKMTGCRYGIGRVDGGYEVRIRGNSDSRI